MGRVIPTQSLKIALKGLAAIKVKSKRKTSRGIRTKATESRDREEKKKTRKPQEKANKF